MHRAAIHLLRAVRAVDAELGIGPARLSALSVLVFGGARTLGALARAEQVTAPTMSRIVDGLVREGLVVRRADPDDLRAVRLIASARARRLLARGRRRRIEDLTARLGQLTGEDRAALDRAAAILERACRPTVEVDAP